MELDKFIPLVLEMRAAQRLYFRTKSPAALQAARDLERRVDAAIKAILSPETPSMFDEPRGA